MIAIQEWKMGSLQQISQTDNIGAFVKQKAEIEKYCKKVKESNSQLWADFTTKIYIKAKESDLKSSNSFSFVSVPSFD